MPNGAPSFIANRVGLSPRGAVSVAALALPAKVRGLERRLESEAQDGEEPQEGRKSDSKLAADGGADLTPPPGEPETPLRKTRTPLLTPLVFHQLQVPLTASNRAFSTLVFDPPLCVTAPPLCETGPLAG